MELTDLEKSVISTEMLESVDRLRKKLETANAPALRDSLIAAIRAREEIIKKMR